ncbi:Uncharacterised protein [Bordetella ansorpii]|uniref:Uncharacterized protein n=1 Tax=Bordetella ansorpii TaxID=288768 RepID=A0A157SU04_9BORD|nr:hypothetical protein [Bordetella ansorpii]SAI73938.1 Uncharacterised protein [Bordetella ansorpii]
METLVALLAWTIDKVWPFPVFIICLVLIVLGIARLMGVQQGSVPLMVLLVLLMICIPFGTPALFMFGPRWVAPLVYEYGTPGQAVIASSKDTGNVYNNRPVLRYDVTLQKADGQKIQTYFDSSDFNVYPQRDAVTYPAPGQPFPVRYLSSRPRHFVIVMGDDASASAKP